MGRGPAARPRRLPPPLLLLLRPNAPACPLARSRSWRRCGGCPAPRRTPSSLPSPARSSSAELPFASLAQADAWLVDLGTQVVSARCGQYRLAMGDFLAPNMGVAPPLVVCALTGVGGSPGHTTPAATLPAHLPPHGAPAPSLTAPLPSSQTLPPRWPGAHTCRAGHAQNSTPTADCVER